MSNATSSAALALLASVRLVAFALTSSASALAQAPGMLDVRIHGALPTSGRRATLDGAGSSRVLVPFADIRAAGVDRSGNYYVLDAAERSVFVFDRDGQPRGSMGRSGGGPGEFRDPLSMFVAADGTIAVSDVTANRVTVFDRNGRLLNSVAMSRMGLYNAAIRDTALYLLMWRADSALGSMHLRGAKPVWTSVHDAHQRRLIIGGPAGMLVGGLDSRPFLVTGYPFRVKPVDAAAWFGADLVPKLEIEHQSDGASPPIAFVRTFVRSAGQFNDSLWWALVGEIPGAGTLADRAVYTLRIYDHTGALIASRDLSALIPSLVNVHWTPTAGEVLIVVNEPEPHVLLATLSLPPTRR